MNYPTQQFELLKESLKALKNILRFDTVSMSSLHYIVYQQYSIGQTHNWIYKLEGKIFRGHQLSEEQLAKAKKLLNTEGKSFELYPDKCNDNHIETAMRKAIKEIEE